MAAIAIALAYAALSTIAVGFFAVGAANDAPDVIGKSEDQAMKYASGEAEMGAFAIARARKSKAA